MTLYTKLLVLLTTLPMVACRPSDPRLPLGEWLDPRSGIVFLRIPAGKFVMGSPAGEPNREPQEVPHEVTISSPFFIGKFEVTQQQWQGVMGSNPSRFTGAAGLPVEQVSWFDVEEFLTRLNERDTAGHYRLPTEAQWEYTCRGGTTTAYGIGDTLTEADANIAPSPLSETDSVKAGRQTRTVGSYAPNAWGLHDMHGNVWEWTADEHCPYAENPVVDPIGACGSPLKVIRGGSWYFGPDSARCALRYTHPPADRGFSLGFRVVRD